MVDGIVISFAGLAEFSHHPKEELSFLHILAALNDLQDDFFPLAIILANLLELGHKVCYHSHQWHSP